MKNRFDPSDLFPNPDEDSRTDVVDFIRVGVRELKPDSWSESHWDDWVSEALPIAEEHAVREPHRELLERLVVAYAMRRAFEARSEAAAGGPITVTCPFCGRVEEVNDFGGVVTGGECCGHELRLQHDLEFEQALEREISSLRREVSWIQGARLLFSLNDLLREENGDE